MDFRFRISGLKKKAISVSLMFSKKLEKVVFHLIIMDLKNYQLRMLLKMIIVKI